MSHLQLNQLTRAEELFEAGNLEEALELLNGDEVFEGLNFEQKSYYAFLKGLILLYQNKNLKLIELGESMLREGQELKDQLHCIDGLSFISMGLDLGNRFEEALNKIREANTVIEQISNVSEMEISQRKFRLNVLKTMIDIHTGNMDTAEKSLEELLHSQDEHEITWELLWAITNMAYIQQLIRGRFDVALEYIERAMSLTKKLKCNHFWLGYCHLGIGVIHMQKCEYDMGLKQHLKSLEYFEKINNNWYIAHIYNNLGNLYYFKGEHDTALKYLEEAIILWKSYPLMKEACLDSLIWVSLEIGDGVRAQKYFQSLEDIYNEKKTPRIEVLYKINKARLLKKSSRIRDKAKAEELFKEILENEALNFETSIEIYVNLCDLFLAEYRINNNNEILEEINHYINRLLNLAENSQSYAIFCETFILQAKLALLNFDMKIARRLLTQAQKIAESYGLNWLTKKISHEHDELLRELHKWEILSESNASLAERIELARLDDQITTMLKTRSLKVPKISKEEPVMILILTEGGNLLFSKKFKEDFSFEDDILGGVLTTVNYIINEVFSEGLDRAIFGQFTLLMMPLQPFLICYIYKGDSYHAHIKIKNFLESLQNNNFIWQALQNFFHKSKSVPLHSIPSLESLITEIFVEKK